MYNDWIEVVRGFNVKQDIAICLFGHSIQLASRDALHENDVQCISVRLLLRLSHMWLYENG